MSIVFKVDGFDLSQHVKLNQGEGLDPYDARGVEPQFGENAIGEGAPLLSVSQQNREMGWPVILNPAVAGYAATKDGLHLLIRDVQRVLRNGASLEWRDEGATASTFFDVQFARFEPAYDFRRSAQLWAGGVIRVWVKPYGHTGTSRIIATAAGSQPVALLAVASGALAGDADADTITTINLPSGINGRLLTGIAIGPAAGWLPIWPAASISNAATLIGASGAFASQAARKVISVVPQSLLIPVGATTVPKGPHRVFGLARTAATSAASGVAISALLANSGAALGATALLPTGQGWRVVDLGTFSGGADMLPNDVIRVSGGLVPSIGGLSTSSFDLALLLVLPDSRAVAAITASGQLPAGNPVATFTFDGINGKVIGQDGTASNVANIRPLMDGLRGGYPMIPAGSGMVAVAFALHDDAPQNGAVSVEVRVREKFTYAR